MKKSFLFVAALLMAAVLNAQDLTLNELLNKHFEAIGQKKISDIKTKEMNGKQTAQGMEFPFKLIQKRPDKLRIEVTVQGSQMIQAYNGKDGWMVAPWLGTTDPQDVNEEQLKGFKDQADMDGKLFNWKEKGYQLELLGTEDMEGTEVYKLKLTEKPDKEGEEGDVTYYYIDPDNYVILKMTAKKKIQGAEVESESYMSNFKEQNGILMPFSVETKMNGNTVSQITIDSVKLDVPFEENIFDKPVKKEETNTGGK